MNPVHIQFNSSPGPSLGVEMELELVDADTRELRSAGTEVLEAMGRRFPDGAHPKAKHELLECTVEVITGICTTVAEARADLAATIEELRHHTDPRRLALLCSGTHPFSDWAKQQLSPDPRYHRLINEVQWTGRRLQIFGIHVHVGVRSAEKSIAMTNALTRYIPHFLGLSASSPYWMGQDTGLASSRSKVFEGLPTTGIPHRLADWAEFEQFMSTLMRAKAISSIREVWWDIRPHPSFGTVELRICDGLPTLREVACMAALSQCLVERMDRMIDQGETLEVPPPWVVTQNKWRAARHGIDADVIVDADGRLCPLRTVIAELVEELAPVADELGCVDELRYATTLAAEGPSYLRQREVVARGGTPIDVVDSLIDELRADRPLIMPPGRGRSTV